MSTLGPMDSADDSRSVTAIARSPVGKKILTGLTGLGLATFLLVHMLGNLLLLVSRDRFNQYAYGLDQVKPLLWMIELTLVGFVGVHAVLGIQVYLNRLKARPDGYLTYQSAGTPSHQSWSSRNMMVSGTSLAAFIVWHLWTFKFGPEYTTNLNGQAARDLAQLVIETFQQPIYTVSYGALLLILVLHLRHGLWSALQSIGLILPDRTSYLFVVCNVAAFLLFLGFMSSPVAILMHWVN